jgi:hypothetical protein
MIAQGNDYRGGGDVSGHKAIGRWAGDHVAIVGDYYTEEGDNYKYKNLYDIVEDDRHYKNISPSIRSMLRVIYPNLTIKKQILKNSDRDMIFWNREWKREWKEEVA